MALYKTRAVVIKSMNLSESDRLVTFMTENHGKVKCVAKGARKATVSYTHLTLPTIYSV